MFKSLLIPAILATGSAGVPIVAGTHGMASPPSGASIAGARLRAPDPAGAEDADRYALSWVLPAGPPIDPSDTGASAAILLVVEKPPEDSDTRTFRLILGAEPEPACRSGCDRRPSAS